jgi:hypothetical protein
MSQFWAEALARWEIMAILLIACAVALRHLLLSRALRAVKELDKETAREIRRLYRGRFLVGWIALFAAVALIEWVLLFYDAAPSFLTRREAVLAAMILFLSGVYLHLESLHEATVFVLGSRMEEGKEAG